MKNDSPLAKFILIVATSMAVMSIIAFPKWTVDDAFIAFRYAANLATHGELTWNVGEDPVEGYTGILLPLLLTVGMKLQLPPIVISQIIGISNFVLGGFMLFLLMRYTRVSSIGASLVVLLYATTPVMYTHALGGLETMLFTTGGITLLYVALRSLQSVQISNTADVWLFVLMFLFSLVRPEGVVLSVFIIATLFVQRLRSGTLTRRTVLHVIALYFIPGIIYFVFRWGYYGTFLPNTFYAKQHDGLLSMASLSSLIDFLKLYVLIPMTTVVLFTILPFAELKTKLQFLRKNIYGNVAAVCLASAGYLLVLMIQYLGSNLLMNFSHRFFAPLIPVVLFGAGIVIDRWYSLVVDRRKVVTILLLLIIAVGMAFQLRINFLEIKKEIAYTSRYKKLLDNEHIRVGKLLHEWVPANEWLLVYADAGAIPYYSELRAIDCGKLNDETLARQSLTDQQRSDYYFLVNPGAIVITSRSWDSLNYYPEIDLIVKDERFQNYSLYTKFTNPHWNYYEFVFLRNDVLTSYQQREQALMKIKL